MSCEIRPLLLLLLLLPLLLLRAVSSRDAAKHLSSVLESGDVTDEAWARGLLLRLLRTQSQPASFHGQHCPWCKARVLELRVHLQHQCPAHFLAGYCSAWRLVSAAVSAWRGGAAQRAPCGLQVRLGSASLRCTFDWDEYSPLIKVTAPQILANVIAMTIEIMNVVFIGRLNNPSMIAAVGLGNMTMNLCGLSIIFGFNAALDTLIS